jgi:hypothetical protein
MTIIDGSHLFADGDTDYVGNLNDLRDTLTDTYEQVNDLITGEGTTFLSFVVDDPDGVERTLLDKLRDVESVKDYGALGDGSTVDTTAFVNAGYTADVPNGDYVVNTITTDVSRFTGNGDIKAVNGNRISLTALDNLPKLVQKKIMEPTFGFNNGITDTQIYTNARNALQGIAYALVSGVEKLYVTQRPTGSAWADTERCRIVEFNYSTSGGAAAHVVYSPEINIGHGFDLSASVESGVVYLYSSAVTASGFGGSAAGKGYSKIEWKGASTTQADVTSYQLWGDSGSGHPFEDYNRAGVAVSSDGKLLILVSAALAGNKRTAFIYDKAAVEALGDKLDARPLYKWVIPHVSGENAFSLQGVASDGKLLHILMGGASTFGHHAIITYDLAGNQIRRLQLDDARAQYGIEDLLNHPTLGSPARFEPEGLTIRGEELLMSTTETWRSGVKIVSWQGSNWAASSLNSTTTGVPPSNGSYWVKTTKATTDGVWSDAVNYGNGTAYTLEKKTIYSIRPPYGDAGEENLDSGIVDSLSEAGIHTGESDVNVTFRWRDPFIISGYSERLGTYFNALTYDTSSRWSIYDQRYASDNTAACTMQASFDGTTNALIIRAKNASASQGAGVNFYAGDDPTHPYSIREFTGSSGSERRVTTQNGATTFSASSNYCPLAGDRPDTGNTWEGYRSSVLIGGIVTSTVGVGYNGYNGADVRIGTAATTTATYHWRVINNTGHFEPLTDNTYNIGSISMRVKELFCANGTINTSDESLKEQIEGVDEALFRAWSKVKYCQYKWKDSVAEKGDGARWHFGLIAQRVKEAFESEGLDPFAYGILCYDEWESEEAVVENGEVVKEAIIGGSRYGVRYTEALALECAYLRWRLGE